MSKQTVFLVDGTALCYRSFFALKLSNSKGMSTGSVYGTYQTLRNISSKYKPDYIGVCFDVSRRTFRQEKFKQYKIQRPPVPDDLLKQIPLVKDLISCLGIAIVEKEGFEADDLIAKLCQEAVQSGAKVVIVSSDKDLFQLMTSDKVSIYNYHKNTFTDRDSFIKENGFTPEAIVDYLALAGDSTDNIPGARGIGKVGAARLVKEFKTIENMFSNLDKVLPKTKDILKDNKKNILLSKELVQLAQPDLDLNWQDLTVGKLDTKGLYDLFRELEFKAFLKDIPAPDLNLDLEVKSNPDKKVLSALKLKPLPIVVEDNTVFIYDYLKDCIYKLALVEAKEILKDSQIQKISYDFKRQLLSLADGELQGIYFDVKVAAYVLDSHLADYELENLVAHYLGKHIKQASPSAKLHFIYQLYQLLLPKLKKDGLDKLFFEVEMPLILILSQMQEQGVRVEAKVLSKLLAEVDIKIKKLKTAIFKAAGCEFNLNSPKQLSKVLFEDLGIAPLKKTKTGYSTNEEVLEKLSLQYSIAKDTIEYRHLNKLKNTYVTPLIEEVKNNKGMLHTQFHQTKAQTGRLSSSGPNLQSIPQKGEFSKALRKAFIPRDSQGFILSGDYSQIELRILAHLSQDKNLIKAFSDDLDIHAYTAALLFDLKPDKVSEKTRNIAKRVNFGIIYGMSSYGLARELKISNVEAQNFIDDYFKRYPKVADFSEKAKNQAESKGFVTTVLGRRRKLPEINSSNNQLREFALRQAINAPIQGSCADIVKIAMINIYREFKKKKLQAKLTIQIHDELIFDLPKQELKQVADIVREHMEKSISLSVPIKVNLKAGKNWGQLEDI